MERRLTTILAADVFGYSRLMGADEESTIVTLEVLPADLNDPKLIEHQGRAVADKDAGKVVATPPQRRS